MKKKKTRSEEGIRRLQKRKYVLPLPLYPPINNCLDSPHLCVTSHSNEYIEALFYELYPFFIHLSLFSSSSSKNHFYFLSDRELGLSGLHHQELALSDSTNVVSIILTSTFDQSYQRSHIRSEASTQKQGSESYQIDFN